MGYQTGVLYNYSELLLIHQNMLSNSLYYTSFSVASSNQFPGVSREWLLLATGGVGLLSGVYMFLSYGIAQSRVRVAMRCGEDPVIRAKTRHYTHTPQVSQSVTI